MTEKPFIRRGKEKFNAVPGVYKCQWDRCDASPVYDVIGIHMCADCIGRISRLNPMTGDIQLRRKPV